jgi:hypothetical protein
MGISQKNLREVALKKPIKTVRGSGYEETGEIGRVSIQPLSGVLAGQMYGQKLSKMKLVIAPPGVRITEGMGICLDVAPNKPPDYQVVYVETWPTHSIAHIELLTAKAQKTAEAVAQDGD